MGVTGEREVGERTFSCISHQEVPSGSKAVVATAGAGTATPSPRGETMPSERGLMGASFEAGTLPSESAGAL